MFYTTLRSYGRITDALDSNEDIDIIYIDFRKAFAKVPHQTLLKKPLGYGIQGKVHSWIKKCLTGRSQKVVIEGKSSVNKRHKRNSAGKCVRPYIILDIYK